MFDQNFLIIYNINNEQMADVREMRIFSTTQLNVPSDLPFVLKDFSKDVIVNNPSNIIQFSR